MATLKTQKTPRRRQAKSPKTYRRYDKAMAALARQIVGSTKR